ncbi:hypothetical protein J6590_062097 [Homalodisca vitripennis]|nr:hypothetical protein J6590_062097 [Homalodisca vitripennis]
MLPEEMGTQITVARMTMEPVRLPLASSSLLRITPCLKGPGENEGHKLRQAGVVPAKIDMHENLRRSLFVTGYVYHDSHWN